MDECSRLVLVSDLFPITTDDERDPREDQSEESRRDRQLEDDRPPHHGG